jgi:hypothetical protein
VRLPGPVRVHLLTTGLLTVGLVLYGLVVRFLPAAPAPVQLPWPVLAAGFAATTVFAVHLEFRRHAQSFALSELPLVTGLYLLSPAELVLARLVGSAAALAVHRRQAPTKLAFNLALFLVETCLAVTVFGLLRGSHPLGPRGWGAALLAALTVDLVSALVIVAAISLYERASQWRILLEVAATGALAAVANTSLALVAVLTLVADLRAAGLLLAVAAVLLLAYRGYGSLRQRHHHLERLYDFTRTVTSSPEVDKTVRPCWSRPPACCGPKPPSCCSTTRRAAPRGCCGWPATPAAWTSVRPARPSRCSRSRPPPPPPTRGRSVTRGCVPRPTGGASATPWWPPCPGPTGRWARCWSATGSATSRPSTWRTPSCWRHWPTRPASRWRRPG